MPVPLQYTSHDCHYCGRHVPKSLHTRTHVYPTCSYCQSRDVKAAKVTWQREWAVESGNGV